LLKNNMTIKNKTNYKIYTKITSSFLTSFPIKKLANFKRSKWNFLKLLIKKEKALELDFFDYSLITRDTKTWERIQSTYKSGHLLKRSILKYFGGVYSIKFFKKQLLKKKQDPIIKFLVKPLYRIDVLLWKLEFYSSVRIAQQNIRKKQILVNGFPVINTYFLKGGDIVHITDKSIAPKALFLKKNFFFSFCEIDAYSNTLIVLKDYSALSGIELSTVFKESIDLKNFAYYVSKK